MEDTRELIDGVADVGVRLAALLGARSGVPSCDPPLPPLGALTDDELCLLTVTVEQAGRLIDALRVQAAGEVEERSGFALGTASLAFRLGKDRGDTLLEYLTRVSPAEARRRAGLGTATRPGTALDGAPLTAPHPAVAHALAGGSLGVDAALAITRALDRAGAADPDDLAAAESELVDAARHDSAEEIGVQARVWREALDPDGARPRDERARIRRAFRLGRENDDGLTPFHGYATGTDAALMKSALHEADRNGNTPRFVGPDDQHTGSSTETVVDTDPETGIETTREEPVFLDPRTRAQRHYDVITGLIRAGTRTAGGRTAPPPTTGPTGIVFGEMRSTAQITVVCSLEDFATGRGIGWLDRIGEPIPASEVQLLAETAGFALTLLGNAGETLYLGPEHRYFTTAQVRALVARDGQCVWPCCTQPAEASDAHHVLFHRDGGPTDIDNGALLCPEHHRMLHDGDFRIEMRQGRPWMLAPPHIDPTQTWTRLGKSRLEKQRTLRTRRRRQ